MTKGALAFSFFPTFDLLDDPVVNLIRIIMGIVLGLASGYVGLLLLNAKEGMK